MSDSLTVRNGCPCTTYVYQDEPRPATRERRLAEAMVETYGKQHCLLRASHIQQACATHKLNYDQVITEINDILGINKKKKNK
jgi:hypothetical protein